MLLRVCFMKKGSIPMSVSPSTLLYTALLYGEHASPVVTMYRRERQAHHYTKQSCKDST